MELIKRDGSRQAVDFEKIHFRLKGLCSSEKVLDFQKQYRPEAYGIFSRLPEIKHADVDMISQKTIEGLFNGISTQQVDILSAEIAQEMCTRHSDNSVLASRILVSNMQKNVLEILVKRFPSVSRDEISENFFKYSMITLYHNLDKKGEQSPLVAPYLVAAAVKYSSIYNSLLNTSRDFRLDYLGLKTLEKGYLLSVYASENIKGNRVIIETPSVADMRIATGLSLAPTPCPDYYAGAQEFILNNPVVLKVRKNGERKILPNKGDWKKCVNMKLFKSLYWKYMLHVELTNLESHPITEEQWKNISDVYDGQSLGKFTTATPTRFSAGTLRPQGSSCFLVAMEDDSLTGIFNTFTEQGQISKYSGGVGIHVGNLRSAGSYIAGTNGTADGLKPMIQVISAISKYVNQGGKRPGSVAVYVEMTNPQIVDIIRMKRKKGPSTDIAPNLFYGLWISDEFFRCWREKKDWHLFDPAICPKLLDSYDEGFSTTYLSDEFVHANKEKYLFTYRYRKYIRQGKFESKISCQEIMEEIVETIRDEGVPYMLCKDACNRKSNQKNMGTIRSSNLCTEIIQYSDSENTSVCNLNSLCLNAFVREFRDGDNESFKYDVSLNEPEKVHPNEGLNEGKHRYMTFDFEEFGRITGISQRTVDRLIDLNFYPTEKARRGNMRQRSQGLGVQGEADCLAMLKLPWNSKEAQRLRFYIYERMYYECLKSSMELSKINGPYEDFHGSPASQGILHFDMCRTEGQKISFALSMPWDELKENIKKYGLRNSTAIALMPTASTSSIMGNSPCFEPFNSMVYNRKGGGGDVTVFNRGLVDDLVSIGMWSQKMSDRILENHGSIQGFTDLPKKLRDAYLAAYDIEPEHLIDASFCRSWFVDQSQSLNLFVANASMSVLSKLWTRGWIRGQKTLSYYTRTRPATTAQKAQIESSGKFEKVEKVEKSVETEDMVCYRGKDGCISCGS